MAGDDGRTSSEMTVPLDELERALSEKFGVRQLAVEQRVVFVHGVDPATKLPGSVALLEAVPAHVTLPVACGEIKPAE